MIDKVKLLDKKITANKHCAASQSIQILYANRKVYIEISVYESCSESFVHIRKWKMNFLFSFSPNALRLHCTD